MQATSDKTASANFTQTGQSIDFRGIICDVTGSSYGRGGYCNYYHWGRKDAFRSAENNLNPAAGTSLVYKAESVTVGTSIQNPTIFYGTTNPYNASFYFNAWNATATSGSTSTTAETYLETTVKTIYDPCPVGYNVAPANTFVGLTLTNTPKEGNGHKHTSSGLYFPNFGLRYYNTGQLGEVGDNFQGLVAVTAAANNKSRILRIATDRLDAAYITVTNSRTFGHTIRPVREN